MSFFSSEPIFRSIFRYKDAFFPNLIAFVYIATTYVLGFYWMTVDSIVLNLVSIIILAHSMVIAAYFVHECAHESVFKNRINNKRLAEVMLWICGSSYSDFEDIKHKHIRHHSDRADIVSFDFRQRLLAYPRVLKVIQFLEWLYIPALEVLMHALVIVLPFVKESRKPRRIRVVGVLILRVLFFVWLISISPWVALFYPIAYMLFLTVMRFMDVHQHTYELFETLDKRRGPEARLRDAEFEEHNTFSNLISKKYPWLNLLVLNFCYHNVHHRKQAQPWYKLRSLHEEMYSDNQQQELYFVHLMKAYHRYRVPRILNADPINLPVQKEKGETFIGVDGVSFLTAH